MNYNPNIITLLQGGNQLAFLTVFIKGGKGQENSTGKYLLIQEWKQVKPEFVHALRDVDGSERHLILSNNMGENVTICSRKMKSLLVSKSI